MQTASREKARALIEPIVSGLITRWEDTQNLLILHMYPDKEDPSFDEHHPVLGKIRETNVSFFAEVVCGGRLKVSIYRV
jgi:hypothetical protein